MSFFFKNLGRLFPSKISQRYTGLTQNFQILQEIKGVKTFHTSCKLYRKNGRTSLTTIPPKWENVPIVSTGYVKNGDRHYYCVSWEPNDPLNTVKEYSIPNANLYHVSVGGIIFALRQAKFDRQLKKVIVQTDSDYLIKFLNDGTWKYIEGLNDLRQTLRIINARIVKCPTFYFAVDKLKEDPQTKKVMKQLYKKNIIQREKELYVKDLCGINSEMFGHHQQIQRQQHCLMQSFPTHLSTPGSTPAGNVSMQNQTIAGSFASNFKSELSSTSSSSYSPSRIYENTIASHQAKMEVNRESAKPLQEWMNKNITNPYPSHHVVKKLSKITGFTYKQIRNWFSTRRHRFKQHCTTFSRPLPWLFKKLLKK